MKAVIGWAIVALVVLAVIISSEGGWYPENTDTCVQYSTVEC